MAEYHVNKGIGQPVEFKGFKGQYIYYLAASFFGIVLFTGILIALELNIFIAVFMGILALSMSIFFISSINKKYGEYGLSKKQANEKQPQSLVVRN